MHIDSKTARDLEIYRTRDGGAGIFDVLNLSRTKGGSGALRARFENPLSEPELIRQVQDGLNFLLKEDVAFPLRPDLVETVARYLEASWDVASGRRGLGFWLESAWVALRYRDLLRYAREGVAATDLLLSRLGPFLKDLLEESPPEEVLLLAQELLDLLVLFRPTEGTPFRWRLEVFSRDRLFRKEGRESLDRVLELLFDLDAQLAMAEGMRRFNLVFPEIVSSPGFVLEGEGIHHPFLDDPVRNPVTLSEGKKLIFLTGPNMAGKTTYLKAVSISAFLAHLGMGVPASRFRITPLEALFSSLSPEENIREGLSYFMAEVRRVREAAEVVTKGGRAFIVFDEVFRGTNVKDAFDASLLVMRGFGKSPNCGFIFSSHLVELSADLRSEPGVLFTCFDGEIREGRAEYDFKLKDGVSQQRFGLQLLEQEGVPDLLQGLGSGTFSSSV